MKRSISALLLALVIALGAAFPAEASDLFPPVKTYDGRFTDVAAGDWYYENVASLYALGLTVGRGSTTTFAPKKSMTVAEVITMAARLRSIHDLGTAEAGADQFRAGAAAWYVPYQLYLRSVSVVGTEFDKRMDHAATRAEVARILARTLPANLFENINAQAVAEGYATGQYIQDVTDYTPYQQEILTLYRWGILSGTDGKGSFCPMDTILRCEVAAMVTRLVDKDLRITLKWKITEPEEITSLSGLISFTGSLNTAPQASDAAGIDGCIRYMLSRGERTLTLHYDHALTRLEAQSLMTAFLSGIRRYPEQTYNRVEVAYSSSGDVVLTFSSSLYSEDLVDFYRDRIFAAAMEVRYSLYRDGSLSEDMTEYDKAWVYYTWLCQNCDYDYKFTENSLSHSAYSVFFHELGVCDGYTAALNLFLRLEGIQCEAIEYEAKDHIWTRAVLDGVTVHIDATWGDQPRFVDYRYFAMTEKFAYARFG